MEIAFEAYLNGTHYYRARMISAADQQALMHPVMPCRHLAAKVAICKGA